MDLPQIRMSSQFAKIAISTTAPVQSIEQPKSELYIEQPKAELAIYHAPSRLTIDQSQAWADMNLKTVTQLIADHASEGEQDALAGMARRSQEGDEQMRTRHGTAIASQAKRNSETPLYDVNIGWIPSANSVKLNYDPGNLDIEWNTHKSQINVEINRPVIENKPGDVNIRLAQYNDLKIDFANLKFVGINYEQLI